MQEAACLLDFPHNLTDIWKYIFFLYVLLASSFSSHLSPSFFVTSCPSTVLLVWWVTDILKTIPMFQLGKDKEDNYNYPGEMGQEVSRVTNWNRGLSIIPKGSDAQPLSKPHIRSLPSQGTCALWEVAIGKWMNNVTDYCRPTLWQCPCFYN